VITIGDNPEGQLSMECHFCVEIYAPQGLRGIEPHLVHSGLALEAWPSGYNGKVILRAPLNSDFDWEMDSSNYPLLFASGIIPGDVFAAEARLRTLSSVLRMANFPHRILLDHPPGNLHASIEHEWPRQSAR
jgi:hypothetical protein